MRYIYTALVFAVLLVSCKDKPKIDRAKTDWEFYKFKGDVKSVSEKTEATGQEEGAAGRETEYDTDYIFNETGMLVTEKKYLPGNKLFQEITYNGKDKMVKHIQYVNNAPSVITEYAWDKGFANTTSITKRNADNSQLDRVGMKYNANGKLIEKTMYNRQDIPVEKITYEYDDKGNLTAENFYLDKDAVQVTNKYEYSGQNKITEIKVKPDGSLIYKTFFEYNSDNKLVKSGTTSGNGEVQYTRDIIYDDNGNITAQITNEVQDNIKTIDKYIYDDNNNKTGWTSYMNDKPVFEVEYKYNSNNNITYMKVADMLTNTQPVVKSYTYDYDKKGNWVKKTILVNSTPVFVTTRKINYL